MAAWIKGVCRAVAFVSAAALAHYGFGGWYGLLTLVVSFSATVGWNDD